MPEIEVSADKSLEMQKYVEGHGGIIIGSSNLPLDTYDGEVFKWMDEPIVFYGVRDRQHQVLCSNNHALIFADAELITKHDLNSTNVKPFIGKELGGQNNG